MFWFQKESGAEPCPVGYALSLTGSFKNSNPRNDKEIPIMTKKLLLLASLMLALASIVSADYPIPPCDPHCPNSPSAQR